MNSVSSQTDFRKSKVSGLEDILSGTGGKNTDFKFQLERIFDRLFFWLALILIPAVALASLRIQEFGFSMVYPIQWCTTGLILACAFLRGRLPFRIRYFGFLAAAFIHGLAGVAYWAFLGMGQMVMVFLVCQAVIGGSVRHGFYLLGLAVVGNALIGAAYVNGWLTGTPGAAFGLADMPTLWINSTVAIFTIGCLLVVFIGQIKKFWMESIESLEKGERTYRLLADNVSDVIWMIDMDGKLVYVSPSVERVTGYSQEEFIQLDESEILPPEARRRFRRIMQLGTALVQEKRKLRGHPYRDRFQIKCKDGSAKLFEVMSTFICDPDGMVSGILGVSRDVTAQHKAEQEMKRMAHILEQASESVLYTDERGLIQYVNPAFERVTGYSRAEVMNQSPRILKSGVHDASFYRQMWDTLRNGRIWQGRIVNKNKAGDLFIEDSTIVPVKERHEGISGFIAVKRDITEQEKLERQVQHAQKMEAVGQLAGGVAHDFNNILQVIVGYSEVVKAVNPDEGPVPTAMEEIIKATERARVLVRQLLAFSRKEVFQEERVDLPVLVGNMTKIIRRLIGEQIELIYVPGKNLPKITVDPGQIEQALLNLCLNAKEAMPDGGQLTVHLDTVNWSNKEAKAHPGCRTGLYAVIEVRDNGGGIDPEIRERIFEPFFTTKDVGQGSGLGLATVYAICNRHGGFVDLETEMGVGSTFRVFLPIEQDESPERPPARPAPERTGRGETVLVAEDDPQVRRMVELILTRAGYRVVLAEDGRRAMDLFESMGEAIDAAVLDVVMPRANGKQVYEHSRILGLRTPIVFASGHTYEVLKSGKLPDGDYMLMRKPYQQAKLLEQVAQALHSSPSASVQELCSSGSSPSGAS